MLDDFEMGCRGSGQLAGRTGPVGVAVGAEFARMALRLGYVDEFNPRYSRCLRAADSERWDELKARD